MSSSSGLKKQEGGSQPSSQTKKPKTSSSTEKGSQPISVAALPAARISLSSRSATLTKSQLENNQLFEIFINKKLQGKVLGVGESFELLLLGKKEVFVCEQAVAVDATHKPDFDLQHPANNPGYFLVTDHTAIHVSLLSNSPITTNTAIQATEAADGLNNQVSALQKGNNSLDSARLVKELHAGDLKFMKNFITQAVDVSEHSQPKFITLLVCGTSRSGKSTVALRLHDMLEGDYKIIAADLEEQGVLSVVYCLSSAATFL
jgi:hypothetical protein